LTPLQAGEFGSAGYFKQHPLKGGINAGKLMASSEAASERQPFGFVFGQAKMNKKIIHDLKYCYYSSFTYPNQGLNLYRS
jgi:hypothetical protein